MSIMALDPWLTRIYAVRVVGVCPLCRSCICPFFAISDGAACRCNAAGLWSFHAVGCCFASFPGNQAVHTYTTLKRFRFQLKTIPILMPFSLVNHPRGTAVFSSDYYCVPYLLLLNVKDEKTKQLCIYDENFGEFLLFLIALFVYQGCRSWDCTFVW